MANNNTVGMSIIIHIMTKVITEQINVKRLQLCWMKPQTNLIVIQIYVILVGSCKIITKKHFLVAFISLIYKEIHKVYQAVKELQQ